MKVLKILYYGFISITLIIVAIFEAGILPDGILAHDTVLSYRFEYIMEILTIILIPLALKLFSLKKVKLSLIQGKENSLLKWGILRILMLGVPLLLNAVLYYLFLAVAFGYLGIIILISFVFITPTKSRCEEEITPNS